uniref:Interleukin 17d n=1 Tax=Sinocyclocheilus grahami TaxID=75366 RepID=A0A672SFV9_SINGR
MRGRAPGERGLKVSRRAPRTRSCLDLPEEILEQMFGVLSAFHHTLQLAPPERQNLTCQSASRLARDKPRTSQLPQISHDPARYPRYLPEAYGEESEILRNRKTQKSKPSVKRVSSKNSSTFRKNGLELIHF